MNDNSILESIEALLETPEGDSNYDSVIKTHINSVFMILRQIGIGPKNGFIIKSKEETWSDFLDEDLEMLEAVRTYVYLKVKLIFDPPSSTIVLESINGMIKELETRFNYESDSIE